ncbi:hypothetical protein BCV72DRAFT_118493 [Rhizopus microsporus var. microsporus]|uniref:Uncharacterized protein n=1 Tax=Rhizopus microsporus var. microsporus TaxID=86635 RepID=A0A1X0R484_RHIZD|nr:hypothetical protein BCV72DRAFT_118493 [Rhizopus microsporus var. microsporus]
MRASMIANAHFFFVCIFVYTVPDACFSVFFVKLLILSGHIENICKGTVYLLAVALRNKHGKHCCFNLYVCFSLYDLCIFNVLTALFIYIVDTIS